MNLDNIFIGNTEPKQTNVLWIDTSDNDNLAVKSFINGKWIIISSASNIYVNYIDDSQDTVTQTLNLKKGINYISTYIHKDNISFFNNRGFQSYTRISELDATSFCIGNIFFGALSNISDGDGLKIDVPDDIIITLDGQKIQDDVNIDLVGGWTWISYPYDYEMNVSDALNGFDPQEGDIIMYKTNENEIKSTFTYQAIRGVGKWDGEIQVMKPGLGYMYYTKTPRTAVYEVHSNQSVVKNISFDNGNVLITKIKIDDHPTENSNNLITSGAVYEAIHNLNQ